MKVELRIGWSERFFLEAKDAQLVFNTLIYAQRVDFDGNEMREPIRINISNIDWNDIAKAREAKEAEQKLADLQREYNNAVARGLIEPAEQKPATEGEQ